MHEFNPKNECSHLRSSLRANTFTHVGRCGAKQKVFAPGGQLYPRGPTLPLGANFTPGGQIYPLMALFTPGGHLHSWGPWWPFSAVLINRLRKNCDFLENLCFDYLFFIQTLQNYHFYPIFQPKKSKVIALTPGQVQWPLHKSAIRTCRWWDRPRPPRSCRTGQRWRCAQPSWKCWAGTRRHSGIDVMNLNFGQKFEINFHYQSMD
jgi:hypothetical protein